MALITVSSVPGQSNRHHPAGRHADRSDTIAGPTSGPSGVLRVINDRHGSINVTISTPAHLVGNAGTTTAQAVAATNGWFLIPRAAINPASGLATVTFSGALTGVTYVAQGLRGVDDRQAEVLDRDAEGTRAVVEGADERDRGPVRGWTESTDPTGTTSCGCATRPRARRGPDDVGGRSAGRVGRPRLDSRRPAKEPAGATPAPVAERPRVPPPRPRPSPAATEGEVGRGRHHQLMARPGSTGSRPSPTRTPRPRLS
jgi:hypothetical protein